MHIVGRYEKTHIWHPSINVLTPSIIFDTHKNRLEPYNLEEWIYYSGLSIPNTPFSGGTLSKFNYFDYFPHSLTSIIADNGTSLTSRALDNNYIPGTSGKALAGIFWSVVDSPITDIYFYIPSFTGTAANVNDILVEIRSFDTTNHRPGNTAGHLLESVSFNPASTVGWNKVTGFNTTPTLNAQFAVCIGDPDGNTTDYATVTGASAISNQFSNTVMTFSNYGCETTNGWTSALSAFSISMPTIVLVHADGSVEGNSLTISSAHANNALERGNYLGDMAFTCTLFAVSHQAGIDFFPKGKVYDGTTNPGGTTLATSTFVITQGQNTSFGIYAGGFVRPFPQLTIGNSYRVVVDPGNSGTTPGFWKINTGADANLRKARPGYGEWYQTDESGGAWTDSINDLSVLSLLIGEVDSVSSSVAVPSNQRTYPRTPIGM